MTTSMLMFITNTWTAGAMESTVIFYALAFGGTGQLLAGMLDVSLVSPMRSILVS